jgi:hypothetical protein
MTPSTYNPSHLEGFFTFCALQIARIHSQLYPEALNPRHVRGPRRPDLQETERKLSVG